MRPQVGNGNRPCSTVRGGMGVRVTLERRVTTRIDVYVNSSEGVYFRCS